MSMAHETKWETMCEGFACKSRCRLCASGWNVRVSTHLRPAEELVCTDACPVARPALELASALPTSLVDHDELLALADRFTDVRVPLTEPEAAPGRLVRCGLESGVGVQYGLSLLPISPRQTPLELPTLHYSSALPIPPPRHTHSPVPREAPRTSTCPRSGRRSARPWPRSWPAR